MRILLLLLLLAGQYLYGQSDWSFESKIEFNQYSTYSGVIDQKYPITMYLEESYKSCDGQYSRWSPRIVYGWYMYDKIGKKIPLVGHVCYADACETYKVLYVPEDPVNYSFDDSCGMIDAKEVFRQERFWDPGQMVWRMKGGEELPVEFETEHEFSFFTRAYLILKMNDIVFAKFDLSKLADNKYIDHVEILGQKWIDNHFHMILKYSHQSNPGSYGYGNCGSGIEEFIGYIKVDKNFDVAAFKKIQSHSCIESKDTEVIYDIAEPELGIREEN